MSQSSTKEAENYVSWTEKQREEWTAKFKEQKVAFDELSSLKKDRRVYRQQPNSSIYFLADRSQTLSECKKTFDDMIRTHQENYENIPPGK